MSKMIGKWVASNTLDENHLKTTVGGNGLTGGNGTPFSVQNDGGTISVGASGIKVPDAGITGTQLNTSVAGAGLAGGGGAALSVNVDDSTVEVATDTLQVKDAGITGTQLATSVAGVGLAGGGGAALSVNVDDSSIEIATDTLQVKALGITNAMLAGSIELSKLEEAVIQADGGQAFTANQSMGSNKLTNLTDGADANDAVNKGQLDAAVTGIAWKSPVDIFNLIGNATIATINGLSPAAGDAYVATDAGTPTAGTSDALVAGSVAEYDGTQWKELVAGSGGFVADGTRAILSTATALISPYTDATDDGKVVDFDGTTLTGADTGDAADANAVLVQDPGHISVYDNLGYVFEGTVPTGTWIQFTGAGQINAGNGLTKSGNTLNVGQGNGITVAADAVAVNADSTTGGNILPVSVSANGVGVDVAAIDGNGLTAASASLSVDSDTETGGNIQGANVTANGVGLDVSAIAGTNLEADGSANLRIATSAAGNGLTGGGASALSVGAGNGISVAAAAVAVAADATGGANLATVVDVNSNGVAIKIDDDTIGENGSSQLYVKANSIGAAEIDETDTYDFGSGVLQAATQSQSDGSTKVATTSYVDTAVAGMSSENVTQIMHKITAGETAAGYFTLATAPINAQSVRVTVVTGPMQVSKQVVAATGATPDFDVLSTNQVHFNNAGAATGLSADMTTDDIVIVEYEA